MVDGKLLYTLGERGLGFFLSYLVVNRGWNRKEERGFWNRRIWLKDGVLSTGKLDEGLCCARTKDKKICLYSWSWCYEKVKMRLEGIFWYRGSVFFCLLDSKIFIALAESQDLSMVYHPFLFCIYSHTYFFSHLWPLFSFYSSHVFLFSSETQFCSSLAISILMVGARRRWVINNSM